MQEIPPTATNFISALTGLRAREKKLLANVPEIICLTAAGIFIFGSLALIFATIANCPVGAFATGALGGLSAMVGIGLMIQTSRRVSDIREERVERHLALQNCCQVLEKEHPPTAALLRKLLRNMIEAETNPPQIYHNLGFSD